MAWQILAILRSCAGSVSRRTDFVYYRRIRFLKTILLEKRSSLFLLETQSSLFRCVVNWMQGCYQKMATDEELEYWTLFLAVFDTSGLSPQCCNHRRIHPCSLPAAPMNCPSLTHPPPNWVRIRVHSTLYPGSLLKFPMALTRRQPQYCCRKTSPSRIHLSTSWMPWYRCWEEDGKETCRSEVALEGVTTVGCVIARPRQKKLWAWRETLGFVSCKRYQTRNLPRTKQFEDWAGSRAKVLKSCFDRNFGRLCSEISRNSKADRRLVEEFGSDDFSKFQASWPLSHAVNKTPAAIHQSQ